MAVNSIVRARIDERTKKQAAAAWLRVDATRIAQAFDEGVAANTNSIGPARAPIAKQAVGERYRGAGRWERHQILDEVFWFCACFRIWPQPKPRQAEGERVAVKFGLDITGKRAESSAVTQSETLRSLANAASVEAAVELSTTMRPDGRGAALSDLCGSAGQSPATSVVTSAISKCLTSNITSTCERKPGALIRSKPLVVRRARRLWLES
jgi:hypothetical protein